MFQILCCLAGDVLWLETVGMRIPAEVFILSNATLVQFEILMHDQFVDHVNDSALRRELK